MIITAASSSVGLAALQVARASGAEPVAASRGRLKAPALRAAGAATVIATSQQDIVEEIARITAGAGVPLIFDAVAGTMAERLMQCLAHGGTLLIYGGLSNEPASFPRRLAIRGNLSMRGVNFYGLLRDPERLQAARAAILRGMESDDYSIPIAHVFSLGDISEAHSTLERNEHIGKIVVVVK